MGGAGGPSTTLVIPPNASPQEAAVTLAKMRFAEMEGVAAESVVATDIREMQWSSSALGCPEPGQMYAQVITPGYRIVVGTGTKQRTFHSDMGGGGKLPTVVTCEDEAVAGSPDLGGPALQKARDDLRGKVGADAGEFTVVSSHLAPVTRLVCDDAPPATPDEGPKKVILEFHIQSGDIVHVYRAWGDDILYCGTTDDLILE
jgi:hypothetical protein